MSAKHQSILVISDMHHPYAHKDAFKFLRALKRKHHFTEVVCIGDEIDAHALSYHEHDPDLPAAEEEFTMAVEALKPIYKLFPKVTVIESNHGSLVLRKAKTAGIPKRALRSYNEILEAPTGWKWKFDHIIDTPLGPVYFCHGKTTTAGKLASQYGMSTCQGHFHEKAQIHYISTPDKLMFDAHTGCLADDKSLALGYNKVNAKRPIVSVMIILDGIPQILPMVLNRKGRWVGRL